MTSQRPCKKRSCSRVLDLLTTRSSSRLIRSCVAGTIRWRIMRSIGSRRSRIASFRCIAHTLVNNSGIRLVGVRSRCTIVDCSCKRDECRISLAASRQGTSRKEHRHGHRSTNAYHYHADHLHHRPDDWHQPGTAPLPTPSTLLASDEQV